MEQSNLQQKLDWMLREFEGNCMGNKTSSEVKWSMVSLV